MKFRIVKCSLSFLISIICINSGYTHTVSFTAAELFSEKYFWIESVPFYVNGNPKKLDVIMDDNELTDIKSATYYFFDNILEKKIIKTYDNKNNVKEVFYYDKNMMMSAIEFYNDENKIFKTIAFIYDNKNNIIIKNEDMDRCSYTKTTTFYFTESGRLYKKDNDYLRKLYFYENNFLKKTVSFSKSSEVETITYFFYDNAGRVLREDIENYKTTDFLYDDVGRLINIHIKFFENDNTESVDIIYDENNNIIKAGNMNLKWTY